MFLLQKPVHSGSLIFPSFPPSFYTKEEAGCSRVPLPNIQPITPFIYESTHQSAMLNRPITTGPDYMLSPGWVLYVQHKYERPRHPLQEFLDC